MQQLAIAAGVVGLLAALDTAIDMRISSQLQPINTKLDDLTTILKDHQTYNNKNVTELHNSFDGRIREV